MSVIPRTRVLALMKTQCQIFNTIFNPEQKRQGTKILRQRLKGPTLAAYYPRRVVTFKDLQAAYPDYEMYNEAEQERLEMVRITKARGKGPPKKSKGPKADGKKK